MAGLVGSWVKSQVEPPLQAAAERLFPPSHDAKELPGADVTGKPERMPPARLAQQLTPRTLSTEEKLKIQDGIHYAFGAGTGVAYGVVSEAVPALRTGLGLPLGVAVWAGAHAAALPAPGLTPPITQLPASVTVWELGSHLVFGVTVDVVRRVVRGLL